MRVDVRDAVRLVGSSCSFGRNVHCENDCQMPPVVEEYSVWMRIAWNVTSLCLQPRIVLLLRKMMRLVEWLERLGVYQQAEP
jgi:hypothetical protein